MESNSMPNEGRLTCFEVKRVTRTYAPQPKLQLWNHLPAFRVFDSVRQSLLGSNELRVHLARMAVVTEP